MSEKLKLRKMRFDGVRAFWAQDGGAQKIKNGAETDPKETVEKAKQIKEKLDQKNVEK